MASDGPETLERLWRSGRHGYLSPLEQMRVWVLRDVLVSQGAVDVHDYLQFAGI